MQLFVSGLLAGFISGLGMGGGVILVAILTYVTKYNQLGLQTINLLYYIPTAIFAIVVYLRNKQIDYKLAGKIILWGIAPTIISATIANMINTAALRKIFAIYLIIIGIIVFKKRLKK